MSDGSSTQDIKKSVFRFEVDAGLLFQLGEQLVARRSVALAELVKNAYDADATRVTVLLDNVTSPNGTIIIDDNGAGMTFEEVRDHWMRIATPDKVDNPISSRFGRPRTGAKGIGRFAARRLSRKMTLHSVAAREDGSKERVIIDFDWENEFQAGKNLTQIDITYAQEPVDDEMATGVMLFLEKARNVWKEDDVSNLQRDLFTLASPFPQDTEPPAPGYGKYEPDPGFEFELEAPEFPHFQGELGETFIGAAWASLNGSVDEHGIPTYNLSIRDPVKSLHFTPSEEVFPGLSGVRFTINYFVYRAEFFKGYSFGLREAQRKGREEGGVRIYLDGFRVFPYGDRGDDWLGLDEVRAGRAGLHFRISDMYKMGALHTNIRPELSIPGNNQVFGAVAISRLSNPGIEINVSRERLVENTAYENLRRFVILGLYWMTVQYARVRLEQRVETAQETVEAPAVRQLLLEAQEQVRELDTVPASYQERLLQVIDNAILKSDEVERKHIDEISMLRVMSSTGTVVAVINHQLRAIVDGVRAIQVRMSELLLKVMPVARPEFKRILDSVTHWQRMVTLQVSQLGFLLGKTKREQKRRLLLREQVKRATDPLTLYMQDFGINFENHIPMHIRTPYLYEAELHAVLLHIFTNALKAVRDRPVPEIAAKAEKKSNSIYLHLLDNGPGVPPRERERVFEPFVTASSPDPILGVGTGLGLKIVRDILSKYDATAHFIDPDSFSDEDHQWKTCMEIIFPESV